ncbi:sensor histidine kinase [Sphingosinicella terrae]|uniref:sensor histidine kinase n=1 Tax=Sphingosinicella terrae TaxID=2172047 RepID=UPI000E0D96A8|nr:histidine kinase [Sphingosinicella terrae]
MASIADPPAKSDKRLRPALAGIGPAILEPPAATLGVIAAAAANCERLEQASEALARSRYRLRAILDAAGDSYLLVDPERRILDLNGVLLNALGRARADCVGHDYRTVIDSDGYRAVIEQTFRRGRAVEMETPSLLHRGERVRLCGMPDEDGMVVVGRRLAGLRPATSADAASAPERVLMAREQERRRLARELHDSVQQDLVAIGLSLHAFGRSGRDGRAAATREVRALLHRAQLRIRTCAFLMHPPELMQGDLVSALTSLTTGLERRIGVKVRLVAPDEIDLDRQQARALYRIAQEALTNVYRHARARHVIVRLHPGKTRTVLDIEDDGVGFDIDRARRSAGGLGLDSMCERAAECRGRLVFERLPRGMLVRATLPARSI